MKPEAAFVLALAAGNVEGVQAAERATLDWRRVPDLAALHQVDALCWWMWQNVVDVVDKARTPEVPINILDKLRLAYVHHWLRNESLSKDIALLEDALLSRGVKALYLKGPWVAHEAYPDPSTRPVNDIDLCVRETQYLKAIAALRSAGWQPAAPLPQSPAQALERSHYRRQLRFWAKGRRPVELHFRLINIGPPMAEECWVWDSSRELPIGGCTVSVPGSEAMFLHLLLHANQHAFAVLRLLHDVRWALERDYLQLDPETLLFRIQELSCRTSCYHTLQLAADLADAPVWDSLLAPLRPSPLRRLLFSLTWRLQKVRSLETSRRPQGAETAFFYLSEMGRVRDKAVFLARVLSQFGYFKRRHFFGSP